MFLNVLILKILVTRTHKFIEIFPLVAFVCMCVREKFPSFPVGGSQVVLPLQRKKTVLSNLPPHYWSSGFLHLNSCLGTSAGSELMQSVSNSLLNKQTNTVCTEWKGRTIWKTLLEKVWPVCPLHLCYILVFLFAPAMKSTSCWKQACLGERFDLISQMHHFSIGFHGRVWKLSPVVWSCTDDEIFYPEWNRDC